jgi:hypothetical protein
VGDGQPPPAADAGVVEHVDQIPLAVDEFQGVAHGLALDLVEPHPGQLVAGSGLHSLRRLIASFSPGGGLR